MTYSRANPSPRYLELVSLYRHMHEEGEQFLQLPAEKTFPGDSLFFQAERILRMIDLADARTILDYGSGKGVQYLPGKFPDFPGLCDFGTVADYWAVDSITCYDAAYLPHSTLPGGMFDGVISTDVLEHCPEEDIPWILDEIFGYARKFVFAYVSCYPARKRLPNGENAHCTIRPPDWWAGLLGRVAERHPLLKWQVWVKYAESLPEGGERLMERKIGNCG